MYLAQLKASSRLMDLMSLWMTQKAYFSLLTHTKQLLLVTFCDLTSGIIKWDGTGWTMMDGRHKDEQM